MTDTDPTSNEPIETVEPKPEAADANPQGEGKAGDEDKYEGVKVKYGNDIDQMAKAIQSSNSEAQKIIQEKNDIENKLFSTTKSMVESNPDSLRSLMETDKELADKISIELHGVPASSIIEEKKVDIEKEKEKWLEQGKNTAVAEYNKRLSEDIINAFKVSNSIDNDSDVDSKLAKEYNDLLGSNDETPELASKLIKIAYSIIESDINNSQDKLKMASVPSPSGGSIKASQKLISLKEYTKLTSNPMNKESMDKARGYYTASIQEYGTLKFK